MSKGLFITGTGTDVGKTYVTGLIVKKLNESGLKPAYYKAAMSGNERDNLGELIPGDAKFVKDISGIKQNLRETCPYIYEVAVSPHLASQIEGNPVDLEVVKIGYDKVCSKYDYITVEGSGGILCPIDYINSKLWLEDLINEFKLPSIIIADAGLGTINSVGLTVHYMQSKNLPIKGIIFNNWHGSVMEEDNLKMCEELTGLKVIAKVKPGDIDLDININDLINLYE